MEDYSLGENLKSDCLRVIKSMHCILSENIDEIIAGKGKLLLPRFSQRLITGICAGADMIFQQEPILLELSKPLVIIGDLHGHLLDLLRILRDCHFPPYQSYLFLGDLIDRGEFSLETVLAIYALKILYPENVYIIRGNHEFLNSSSSSAVFADEIEVMYPRTKIYQNIIDSFNSMPVAAKLYGDILCIHGGISPDFMSIEQIKTFHRPISEYKNSTVLTGLLWSDPTNQEAAFAPSRRKSGFLFGPAAFRTFIRENKLRLVIRGHECVSDGYQEMFDRKLITVFSASNYCGTSGNKSAIIFISNKGEAMPRSMLPIGYIKRNNTNFASFEILAKQFPPHPLFYYPHPLKLINPSNPLLKIPSSEDKLKKILRRRVGIKSSSASNMKIIDLMV